MVDYLDLLGKPYSEYGDGPLGWNCYGLVREMLRRDGKELPDLNAVYRAAGAEPRGADLSGIMLARLEDYFEEALRPEAGMMVLLRVNKEPSHVGYMLDRYRMLHVLEGEPPNGVVLVQRLDCTQWKHKREGVYKFRNPEILRGEK